MQLTNTIKNIKESKSSFYNIPKGSEVWFEVLREGICLNNIFFNKLHFHKNNLRLIRETKTHIEFFVVSGEVNKRKFSIRKHKTAYLRYNCYFS